MELGLVGLGRMGSNMTKRLLNGGHKVTVFDRNPQAAEDLKADGAVTAASLQELASVLAPPRCIWLMVPAGEATEETLNALVPLLDAGDAVIDGGNAFYKDSALRAKTLAAHGIDFLDSGTSGGIWGLTEGYSLMVGGPPAAFDRLEPIFQTLAPSPSSGYGHVGPAGAGHFVKMVHNGIEYGLMQAYAEGFELMEAKGEFDLDLKQIAQIWQTGSVVRSWLLDLTTSALEKDPGLDDLAAFVDDSGEGRWTVQESIDLAVPAPVISAALQARFRSRQDNAFGARLLAALRNEFGGHATHPARTQQ
ncbi:MAG: phosphogluconate dehydrogenase (NAD(+)-dependent, decarboxylating) [Dehalococcoidia bacterium]